MTTQTFQTIRTNLWRVMRWSAGDAAMGALCAALFGMIYGGFETLVYGNPWKIIVTAGYFALAGGLAGAVLGAFGAFLESIEASSTASNASDTSNAGHNGLLSNAQPAANSVFHRPTALSNPLIARWQFVESMAGPLPDDTRMTTNGSLATAFGSRLADNGAPRQSDLAHVTESRRPLQRVRWIGAEEAND